MTLKDKITEDMKAAMRAKDSKKLGTIRLLTAAMKQKEVDERVTLSDADIIGIVEKMIKQRRESVKQFADGGRQDLVDNENAEIEILSAYMPQALSEGEIKNAVDAAVADASGIKDMGKVMGVLRTQLAGRADMGVVSTLVKNALSNK